MHQCLHSERVIALTQSYALHGLGGIGKTQLAVEYAYEYALEYSAVLWIGAETVGHIISSFLAIAELLLLPERRETDQQQMIAGVHRWLASHSEWLLIWDNLEDMELFQRYRPSARQGATLITTRCQTLGTLAQGIELPPMTQEDGVLFVLRRAKVLSAEATHEQMQQLAEKQPADYAAAEQLVKVMGGLPLALDQAGAYIEETACGVVGYLRLYEQHSKQLLDRRGTPTGDHPQSTMTTLSLAYERVQQANPAAADLLCLCALLHPDAIPEEIIAGGAHFLGPTLQATASDPYHLDQAIAVLRTYSLVTRSPEKHTLSVHRMVQEVLKENMDQDTRRQWTKRAGRALSAALPSGEEPENWSQYQRYQAHIEVFAYLIEQWKLICPEAGRLLHQAGVNAQKRAQYTQAKQWLSQAHAIRQQVRGTEHLEVAETLNELALLHCVQGKYEEARAYYLQALHIREHLLGEEHPTVAISFNNLGLLYCSWRKYEEAEPLLVHALQILEHLLGEGHPTVASCLGNLGRLYTDQGRYEEAESLLLRVLHIREHLLGEEHPDVMNSLNSLARLYANQERYEKAEALYQRALYIQEERQ